jgi:carnitine-CoA ligase
MNDPAATARKLAGGWLRMGDVGHVDADGWLFFHYRKGGGIRRNGDFVNAAIVEKALAELDCIVDAYVYGIPLPGMAPGEKEVVAAIVPSEPDRFDAQAVFDACAERLDANAVPRFLQVLPEIPKTASEKPLERLMLEAFAVDESNVHARS